MCTLSKWIEIEMENPKSFSTKEKKTLFDVFLTAFQNLKLQYIYFETMEELRNQKFAIN